MAREALTGRLARPLPTGKDAMPLPPIEPPVAPGGVRS